jgi:diguanylate cyclase (GGDEF)-like protein
METPNALNQDVAAVERATTDAVTGLANRAGFEIQARHALVICRRLRLPATMLFFGVDGIEAMRDADGDTAADRILVGFAEALRKVLRGSDILGHRGSGVFTAMLIDCSADASPYVLLRMRAALTPVLARADGSRLEYSIGGAEFIAERHSTIGQLLDDADAELYSQKHARD